MPRAVFVGVSVLLFALSLAFDVTHYANVDHSGIMVLATGWMGPLILQFGWYANPLLLIGWIAILRAQRRRSLTITLVMMSIALLLALSSFPSLLYGEMMGPNEGQLARDFAGFGAAIFLWNASVAVAWVGALQAWRTAPR